jgi:hypothetical protein
LHAHPQHATRPCATSAAAPNTQMYKICGRQENGKAGAHAISAAGAPWRPQRRGNPPPVHFPPQRPRRQRSTPQLAAKRASYCLLYLGVVDLCGLKYHTIGHREHRHVSQLKAALGRREGQEQQPQCRQGHEQQQGLPPQGQRTHALPTTRRTPHHTVNAPSTRHTTHHTGRNTP